MDDSEIDEDALRQTLLQAQAKKKIEDESKSNESLKGDKIIQSKEPVNKTEPKVDQSISSSSAGSPKAVVSPVKKAKVEDPNESMKEDALRETLLLAKKKKEEEVKSIEAYKGDKVIQSKEPIDKAKQTEPKVDQSVSSSPAASPKAVVSSVKRAKVEDPKIQQPQLMVKSKASTEFSGPVTKENPTAAELMDLITKEAELSKVRKTITRYERQVKHFESSDNLV